LLKLARAATATTADDDPVDLIPASSLIKRMAEQADEFIPDSPVAVAFIKAYAAGDRAGMRRAVRPMRREMVAAEA